MYIQYIEKGRYRYTYRQVYRERQAYRYSQVYRERYIYPKVQEGIFRYGYVRIYSIFVKYVYWPKTFIVICIGGYMQVYRERQAQNERKRKFQKDIRETERDRGNEFDFFSADFSRLILVDEREKKYSAETGISLTSKKSRNMKKTEIAKHEN